MLDPETERKNLLLGWGLFVLFALLAAGTVAVPGQPLAPATIPQNPVMSRSDMMRGFVSAT